MAQTSNANPLHQLISSAAVMWWVTFRSHWNCIVWCHEDTRGRQKTQDGEQRPTRTNEWRQKYKRTFNNIDWPSSPSYNLRLKQFIIIILFFFLLFTSYIGKGIFKRNIVCKWYIRLIILAYSAINTQTRRFLLPKSFGMRPGGLRPIFPLSITEKLLSCDSHSHLSVMWPIWWRIRAWFNYTK